MTKLIAISLLSLTAMAAPGCKKSGDDKGTPAPVETTAPPMNASPECKDAGEHVQELVLRTTKADAPDSEKTATFAKSRDVGDQIASACTKDKWPAEAITCVKTTEALALCKTKLTPDQQKSLPSIP